MFFSLRIGLHLATLAWRRLLVQALCWELSSHLALGRREGTLSAVQRNIPAEAAAALPSAPSIRPALPHWFSSRSHRTRAALLMVLPDPERRALSPSS